MSDLNENNKDYNVTIANDQVPQKSKRVTVNSQAMDSDRNLIYDLTFLEPHVWVKPILKTPVNSNRNTRCASRMEANDSFNGSLRFSQTLTQVKEFKKDISRNTNDQSDILYTKNNLSKVQPQFEQAPHCESLKHLESEGFMQYYPTMFKGTLYQVLCMFGLLTLSLNAASIYCLMTYGQNIFTNVVLVIAIVSVITVGVIQLIYNQQQPKAKDDFIQQFSNINGVQLSVRLPDPDNNDQFINLEVADIKHCSIMKLPRVNFIKDQLTDAEQFINKNNSGSNEITVDMKSEISNNSVKDNQVIDISTVECIVVETQDDKLYALSQYESSLYNSRKMQCKINDQVEKWKRMSQNMKIDVQI